MPKDPAEPNKAPSRQGGESEWIVVKNKSRASRNRPPRRPQAHHLSKQPLDEDGVNPPRSPSDIEAEYRKIRSQWEQTSCYSQLCQLVAANADSARCLSHAVCLGIGTFDPPDGGWESKRRTFIQLTAFLVMVEEIERITKASITCYFQEPIFSQSDIDFIRNLGHQVVDSPDGFGKVDSHSLLFGVHLYRPIYVSALHTLPAIFVGTGWHVWDQVTLTQTDDLENLKHMETSYTKTPFPEDSSTTAFSSTSIYWQPPGSSEPPSAPAKSPET
ncbi:hypothetical protein B0I35DRAFT_483239 [Stachybotrys elegans]|uniref:SRR1-like domain-containing protein n=1 Tax=Stachybotrys elegans TaxID=80388 RepID=A0A8K0WL96_9HYPO|nr:hypothetical protein B0I35DRAFT_483239 [Stachybotrys elegans]